MADYIPPPKLNIPFSFSSGGYSPPNFGQLSFHFSVKQINSVMSNLKAAVNVFDTKLQAYTYLKYCDHYIIGYNTAGVQIIRGKCYYGGIRDIGAFIRAKYTMSANLGVFIEGGIIAADLPASISMHPAYNLFAFIRGLVPLNFSSFIRSVVPSDLVARVFVVGPVDISAVLRPYYQNDFTGFIHSWQESNLFATIYRRFKKDLPAWVGVNKEIFALSASIKGWVREDYKDISTVIYGYREEFLPGFVRGTEFRNLLSSLIDIQPVSLGGGIHGWRVVDLPTNVIGYEWPWNLSASIFGGGQYGNLTAAVFPKMAILNSQLLSAVVVPVRFQLDIPAFVYGYAVKNLQASVDLGTDAIDLPAKIYPKMVRLTAVLSISTLRKSDLVGIISVSCRQSSFSDLRTMINFVFTNDISAFIRALRSENVSDLSAKIGYKDCCIVIDKLPLSVYVKKDGFRVEDVLPIYVNSTRSLSSLPAFIFGEYLSVNLPAMIVAKRIKPYEFTEWKKRERVSTLHFGEVQTYKDIEIDFESIVKEYLYSSIGNYATSKEINERWKTRLRSFYPPQIANRYLDRLYKTKILYDLKQFNTIDEAIRYCINYLSSTFDSNLTAQINGVGAVSVLPAKILSRKPATDVVVLKSYIRGVYAQEDDDIVLSTYDGLYVYKIEE